MKSDKTWKFICLLFVAALFYLGHGLHSANQRFATGFFESSAAAAPAVYDGVGVAGADAETIFTCSQDGKSLYRWQYYKDKSAKYLGKSDAVKSADSRKK